MLKVGNGERRRTHDVDIEISAFLPPVKTEVCAAAFMAWDRCRESRFPCNSLASRGKDDIEPIANRIVPADNCHIPTRGAVNSMVTPDIELPQTVGALGARLEDGNEELVLKTAAERLRSHGLLQVWDGQS
jgi:hypothetical protein